MNPELFKGLPEWVRHSKARASKILGWVYNEPRGGTCTLRLEHGDVAVTAGWFMNNHPNQGGYYVAREADTAVYVSAAAFERLYERSAATTEASNGGTAG